MSIMSEKFQLRWNDFQAAVSQSFSLLRREQGLLDVTLVSEDQKHVEAHKLVLSACSGFFKSVLRNNPHPKPLIYLSGVSSSNLELVLDYIYRGEVQIFQEQLDSFLSVAQKLRIEGLNTDSKDDGTDVPSDDQNYAGHVDYYEEVETVYTKREIEKYEEKKNIKTVAVDENFDETQIQRKIQELIEDRNGKKQCKVCGYSNVKNLGRHVEVHIQGLSYNCQQCGKTFRYKIISISKHEYCITYLKFQVQKFTKLP